MKNDPQCFAFDKAALVIGRGGLSPFFSSVGCSYLNLVFPGRNTHVFIVLYTVVSNVGNP